MRFEPRAPDETANVDRAHPLREAATLAAGIAGAVAFVVVAASHGVELLVPLVPADTEARFFRGLEAELSRRPAAPELADPLRRAQALSDRLVRHWPEARQRYRVGVWDAPGANAGAFPGGWILLTRGLLERVRSENELAFVLAHELGHFAARDHLRCLDSSQQPVEVGAPGGGSAPPGLVSHRHAAPVLTGARRRP